MILLLFIAGTFGSLSSILSVKINWIKEFTSPENSQNLIPIEQLWDALDKLGSTLQLT